MLLHRLSGKKFCILHYNKNTGPDKSTFKLNNKSLTTDFFIAVLISVFFLSTSTNISNTFSSSAGLGRFNTTS